MSCSTVLLEESVQVRVLGFGAGPLLGTRCSTVSSGESMRSVRSYFFSGVAGAAGAGAG